MDFSYDPSKRVVVVFTGAGISAESGIKTFRDANGLWENHDIMTVASPRGWAKNPSLVLEFYNQRRAQMFEVSPNPAHYSLVALEQVYNTYIVTQNVDNLHERAGSKYVLHLHGELSKVRSTQNPDLVYEWGPKPLKLGDVCEQGAQLRPHIVWFEEEVPLMPLAYELVDKADVFIIIGTSLQVYPAAGLVDYAPETSIKYLIDPNIPNLNRKVKNMTIIQGTATEKVPDLVNTLLNLKWDDAK